MQNRKLAYVGDVKHGLKTRPLKRGVWRGVCTCERMPVTDKSSQSVIQAWIKHVEEDARSKNTEVVIVR